MSLPDPLTTSGIVLAQKAVQAVARSNLVDSVFTCPLQTTAKQEKENHP